MVKISFVIPCYGSENSIEAVVNEITDTVNTRKDKYDYEIILVNDCSPDGVWKKIQKICTDNDKIRGIYLSKNFGQQSALMAGYRNIDGDLLVSLDDDGQTPVNEVFKLVDRLNEGYDVVYGYYEQRKHSSFRNFGSKVDKVMERILVNRPKNLRSSSFYVARRFVVDELVNYRNPYAYIGGLVFRTTQNISCVPVTQRERYYGESGYTFKKLLKMWLNGFTGFSVKPLRFASYFGIFSSLLGFLFLVYLIIKKIFGAHVLVGWTSTIAVMLIIGGLILFVLGMLGEYVGRIYICINNAPQYVIKDSINCGKDSEN
ncbi:glycosyltransferase family 2 protein [Extibacter muris]|uniref:glycosyltransferase family 2 protein n=1 Tax=Extibacter muris TaxID=1796622 RepID=UPI001D08A3CD|nr:glycosyltransferase family 2 protein [Extibacter muris]MCB6203661.1 glycosyltransferase family 2 protein [Extibacter muris]MCQ4665215.1 glycosyltransferase family 2 protein [Extibacter muris]MCQ4694629.1 glycosyltransferase family 2 protein [Extibacter muris]